MPPAESVITRLVLLTAAAAGASYALGFGVWRLLLAWRVLDKPNARSSHSQPTPRGGGLGIMAIFLTGAFFLAGPSILGRLVPSAAGFLVLISFVDDRRPLPWWGRLGAQFLAALVVALCLPAGTGLERIGLTALMAVLLAGYANAFNFMDGINGLAAGQAALSAAGMAVLAVAAGLPPAHPAVLLCVLLAGAALGFLPHNFPRARMFMGDAGSVPLGFLLMALTAWLAHDGGAWLWVPLGALHAGFILDTGFTLLRRALRGERFYEAHREHFYQRLIRAGRSHAAVTGLQLGLTLWGLVLMGAAVFAGGRLALLLAFGGSLASWTVYFVYCERAFARRPA
jgi:UDP-N-acetylmuramyl pentapeptide phosphotransferase/UDP-N-acetylglucosamine-1-phosphate transferase